MEYIEEYKAEKLEEVVGYEEITEAIIKRIDNGRNTPILFHGPAGTGKTLRARLIAKHINGEDWKAHTLDNNASDDNGVDVVRTTIKGRASQGSFFGKQVIILDEMGYMTSNAQGALRRTMQDHIDNCLFILCTNYLDKVILPIRDRCTGSTYHIGYLSDDEIRDLCLKTMYKAEKDGAECVTPEGLEEVVRVANGHPRAAINYLQEVVEGTYIKPKTQIGEFHKLMTTLNKGDPLAALQYITADDLNDFALYMMKRDLDIDTRAKLVRMIRIADANIQSSHNPDVHLIDMLNNIYEVI